MNKEIRLFIHLILITLIVVIFSNCQGTENEISFPISVGERPESITKGFNGNYYVTVRNAREPGDAVVNEISTKGVKTFFKGLDEPKGIVYLENHLYFSDITRIWKVDSDGKGEIFVDKTDFPEEILNLNDISLDFQKSGIYVTDMGDTKNMWNENNELLSLDSKEAKNIPSSGRVYHIDLQGKITIAQDTSALMPNPNGVGLDNNGNLMIGASFTGNYLITRDEKLVPLNGIFRGADGVEQDKEGNYYVSSWTSGNTWKINKKTEEATVLIKVAGSAADFLLEEDKERLLLPDVKAGQIISVNIQQNKIKK